MKSAIETLNPTRVKLTVEVPYEELKPSVDAAFKAIAGQISVPGFRPGKVPTRIIEQRVGRGTVLQEAVNQALPELYAKAAEENDVRPLGQPEVEITDLPVDDTEQLVFTVEVDVRPEITLPDLSAVSVTVDTLDEAAIDAEADNLMTSLRDRFKTLTEVERAAQQGDFVVIDLSAVIDGVDIDAVKEVSYEIGSATLLEGLDDALVGMSASETKQFRAPLAGGDHTGEEADVTVSVGSVKEAELPELDDDFAQLASEFDTLEELQADLREQAGRSKELEQGVQARDRLLEHLMETVEIPLPEAVIEDEVHSHLEGEDRLHDEEHRTEVEENARTSLKTQLLLDALVETTEVTVSQEEIVEYLVVTAQQYGMDPSQFASMMDQRQQVPAMVADVTRRKALATVLEQVSVVDEAGTAIDLTSVLGGDEADEEADADIEVDVEAAADDQGEGIVVAEVVQEPAEATQDEADADADVVDAIVAEETIPAAAEQEASDADEPAQPGAADAEPSSSKTTKK